MDDHEPVDDDLGPREGTSLTGDTDLGGEPPCQLSEVCISCGGLGEHRPGCALADSEDEIVLGEPAPRSLFSLPTTHTRDED